MNNLMLATWVECGDDRVCYGFGDFNWLFTLEARERAGEVRILHTWWCSNAVQNR